MSWIWKIEAIPPAAPFPTTPQPSCWPIVGDLRPDTALLGHWRWEYRFQGPQAVTGLLSLQTLKPLGIVAIPRGR